MHEDLGRRPDARGASVTHAGAGNGKPHSSRWGTPGVVMELLIAQVARSRRAWTMVMAMALLLTALVVPSDGAQAATLWTSTLTVQTKGYEAMGAPIRTVRGCMPCSGHLSPHTFTINSTVYTMTQFNSVRGLRLAYFAGNLDVGRLVVHAGHEWLEKHALYVHVSPEMPDDAWRGLSLLVGSVGLSMNEAEVKDYGTGTSFGWFEPEFGPLTSSQVTLSISDQPVAPHIPRHFRILRGNGELTIRWASPRYSGGSGITRFEYRHKTTGAFPSTWTPVPDGPDDGDSAGNERGVKVSGLTNGTRYTFELRAVNSAGGGVAASGVESPNAPPTASNRTVTIPEDVTFRFKTSDWGFSDADSGDRLRGIGIDSDPPADAGSLFTFLHHNVTPSQNVSPVPPDTVGLYFQPAPNWNGDNYARFGFVVSDGKDVNDSVYTMTVNVTPVNDPATGKPSISGLRQAGQTLTASAGNISDVDGLPDSFDYQWLRVDPDGSSNPADISGATAGAYTLAAADVGKRIRVRVSFTDQDGHSEQLTSDASGVVQAQGTVNVAPTASNRTVVTKEDTDYRFRTSDFGFADANAGDTFVSAKVVSLPTAGSLLLDDAPLTAGAVVQRYDIDDRKLVFRPAPNANGSSYATFTFKVNDGTADSESPNTITINVTPVNDPVRGRLRVVWDEDKHYVRVSRNDVRDADGTGNAVFYHQHTRTSPSGVTTVSERTTSNSTYMLSRRGETPGTKIKWTMTFTDDDGTAETVVSNEVYLADPTEVLPDAPVVVDGPNVSSAGDDGVWTRGEKVEISLTFNEDMTVLAYRGMPSIGLNLSGTEARTARYSIGNSTDTLVFSYTLNRADGSHSSLTVPQDSLALNDGVIQSRDTTMNASLLHNGVTVHGQTAGSGGGSSGQQDPTTAATGRPVIDGIPRPGGGRDAHGHHIRHPGPRRRVASGLCLSVDSPEPGKRHQYGNRWSHRFNLHRDHRRLGQSPQGEGHLHRRRGQRGVRDQRGNRGGQEAPDGQHRGRTGLPQWAEQIHLQASPERGNRNLLHDPAEQCVHGNQRRDSKCEPAQPENQQKVGNHRPAGWRQGGHHCASCDDGLHCDRSHLLPRWQ